MSTRKILPSALLSTLLLSATPVLAAQQDPHPAAAKQDVLTEHASKVELKAFERVKVSLASALLAAEKHSNGGKVIDASFDVNGGKPVYRAKTYQDNSVWEGMVDAESGHIIGTGQTTAESALDREDQAELAGLRQATTTLAQAVDAAEKRAGGKAIRAGLEETNGNIVYEVTVVTRGSARKLVIDPKNGQVAS